MTGIPPDLSPAPEELREEVHRLVEPIVAAARASYGPIPGAGTAAWWTAPPAVQIAALLILAEAWVTRSPHEIAADQLKAVSAAISSGMDWSANAPRMVFETPGVLAARRAVLATPLRCARPGCPVVVSVEHPLPDFASVRCPRHAEPTETAA